jgi:hypothetical protein
MAIVKCPRCGFEARVTRLGRRTRIANDLERFSFCPAVREGRAGQSSAPIPASSDAVGCPEFNSALDRWLAGT